MSLSPSGVVYAAPSGGLFRRIAGVVISPIETFREIVARPSWPAPLVVIGFVSIVTTAAITSRIDLTRAAREQLEARGGLSLSQIEQGVRVAAFLQRFTAAFIVVLLPFLFVLIAGILVLVCRMAGGKATFRQSFAVTVYAWIPQILKAVIVAALLMPRGVLTVAEPELVFRSNLAFLRPGDPVWTPVLASVDIFSLWTLGLVAVGMSAAGGITFSRMARWLVPLWAVSRLLPLAQLASRTFKSAP